MATRTRDHAWAMRPMWTTVHTWLVMRNRGGNVPCVVAVHWRPCLSASSASTHLRDRTRSHPHTASRSTSQSQTCARTHTQSPNTPTHTHDTARARNTTAALKTASPGSAAWPGSVRVRGLDELVEAGTHVVADEAEGPIRGPARLSLDGFLLGLVLLAALLLDASRHERSLLRRAAG